MFKGPNVRENMVLLQNCMWFTLVTSEFKIGSGRLG